MKGKQKLVVAAFPPPADHHYTQLLYASLERQGFEILSGDFSGRWLLKHLPRIDYCHFHWPSFYYYDTSEPRRFRFVRFVRFARFVGLMLLIRLYGVRIAWTAHNLYPHDGGKASLSHRIARRFLVWVSSAIFVHGPTPKDIFLAEFPRARKKVRSIEHGHVSDHYRSGTNSKDARQMLGLREDCFIYLFFGHCKEYKNLEVLIEAFKEASDECVLVISGRFQNQAYYEKIRSLAEPLGDRVILRPRFIEDDEFQYHLAACDVVVLPYKEILTSGAVMLALSFGRPVVACRKGSLVDIVTPSVGVLFSPDTAEQLAHAMAEARNTAYRHDEILEYARTFDWDRSATITAQVMSSSQPV